MLRQSGQFLIKNGGEIGNFEQSAGASTRRRFTDRLCPSRCGREVSLLSAIPHETYSPRDPYRNLIEPARNISPSHCRRLASQHEKYGLKGILSIVDVTENAAADGQHHWSVPMHQFRESGFAPGIEESPEKVSIREWRVVRGCELTQYTGRSAQRHRFRPPMNKNHINSGRTPGRASGNSSKYLLHIIF
jgi:hypothetical protein